MRYTELMEAESIKVRGHKLSLWKRILITHYVNYMFTELGTNFPLTISLKKMRKGVHGSMELNLIKSGANAISLSADLGPPLLMKFIAHETIHIKQVNDGRLSADDTHLRWDNEPTIEISEYTQLTNKDYAKYAALPWEAEAIKNSQIIMRSYIDNEVYKELQGQDKWLDVVIDIGL
jgi:hypothetical protein